MGPDCSRKTLTYRRLFQSRISRDRGLGGCRLANSPSTLALTFGHRLVVWRNDRNTNPILGTTGRGTFPCWRIGPL